MLNIIEHAWRWTGLVATEIIDQNPFGNVIVRAVDERIWRICPEELDCSVIANDSIEYSELRATAEFREDWEMVALVELATRKFGGLPAERCFCLKIPAMFGGQYDENNIGTITRTELLSFAGATAEQIKDYPDGSRLPVTVKWPAPN